MSLWNIPFSIRLLVVVVSLGPSLASHASPDPRLVPLIPPASQLVAGMTAPQGRFQPNTFLLTTRNNSKDMSTFLALTGVDPSLVIHQVIFIAGLGNRATLDEHSLLAVGRFDQSHIFKAAVENGAKLTEYIGMPVLILPGFARDRATEDDLRWMAFPAPTIAILGSVASVQEEIRRQRNEAKPDTAILRKLNDLRANSDAWCVLVAFDSNGVIVGALNSIDPELGRRVQSGDGFQFSVHYAANVEFTYQITSAGGWSANDISGFLNRSLLGRGSQTSSSSGRREERAGHTLRKTIQIPLKRYETWIEEVQSRRLVEDAHVVPNALPPNRQTN